jgi:prevent-host-death family protein
MTTTTSRVGARELKTRLGRYLNRVRKGHAFVVTDRAEPVAILQPLTAPSGSITARLEALAVLGEVTLPTSERLAAFAPIVSKGPSASDLVRRDRDERG